MSSKFLLKTATASIFAISVITSDHAYAEDGASLDCAMWLCMPGSRLDALVVGSNPIGAGCLSPYFKYLLRVGLPFQSAMTDYENCIDRDYYRRHPEMEIKSDVDTPGLFGGSWEDYEVEVFENGIKKGEWTFEHHERRAMTIPEDPRRRAVRRNRRSGDFSGLFPF